jgi:hypothetical protein
MDVLVTPAQVAGLPHAGLFLVVHQPVEALLDVLILSREPQPPQRIEGREDVGPRERIEDLPSERGRPERASGPSIA